MSNTSNQGGFCKLVCWLIGIAAGGYLAFILVDTYGQDQIQSAVIGIVAFLLVGLITRRMFCRGKSDRVRARIAEAETRRQEKTVAPAEEPKVAKEADAPTPVSTPSVSEKPVEKQPDAEKSKEKTPKPDTLKSVAPPADAIDKKLSDMVNAAATAVVAEGAAKVVSDKVSVSSDAKSTAPKAEKPAAPTDAEPAAKTPITPVKKPVSKASEAPIPVKPLQPKVASVAKQDGKSSDTAPAAPEEKPEEPVVTGIKKTSAPAAAISQIAGATSDNMPSAAKKSVKLETVATPSSDASKPEVVAKTPVAAAKPTAKPEAAAVSDVPKIKPLEPKGLDAPENGTPDDLKQIDGIGEAQETALNTAGIYHLQQFVGMNRRELAWIDENMPGDGAEVSAESWRKQAITLTRKVG